MINNDVTPELISKNLAELKANKVSQRRPGEIVLGADSVIDLNGKLISKPTNRKEAINESLIKLQNKQVLLILGKGIEEYQVYKENKIAHNDSSIVKELIYN